MFKSNRLFEDIETYGVCKLKLVFVSSPLSGDIELNQAKARKYCEFVCDAGNTPVAPHLLFTQFLDDDVQDERWLGIRCGMKLLEKCDEIWVFVGDGVSEGMAKEIVFDEDHRMPIGYFDSSLTEINADETKKYLTKPELLDALAYCLE